MQVGHGMPTACATRASKSQSDAVAALCHAEARALVRGIDAFRQFGCCTLPTFRTVRSCACSHWIAQMLAGWREIRDADALMTPQSAFNRLAFTALVLLSSSIACGDDDDDDGLHDVAVLDCTGTCSCDASTRTCSCAGGTDCTLVGSSDVTFACDGNASCGLSCGDDCDIICPGTTGCIADAGKRAYFECQGNAQCEFTCRADCEVSCGGASRCLVTCEDPDACDLSDCRGSTDCGGGVFACGRACP